MTVTDTTVEVTDDVEATILELFPDKAHWLDHPELGPILKEAAEFEWSGDRLLSAVMATAWWKNTSATARQFDELEKTDPATFNALVQRKATEIGLTATQSGLVIDGATKLKLGRDALRLGGGKNETNSALLAASKDEGTTGVGTIDAQIQPLREAAARMHVPVNEEMLSSWATRIFEGALTTEGVGAWIDSQARAMFPQLSAQFDLGLTTEDYIAPMRTSVAQELDMNPNEIVLTNPKWSALYGMSSMTDARTWARRQPEWKNTKGANDQTEAMVLGLAKTFGELK